MQMFGTVFLGHPILQQQNYTNQLYHVVNEETYQHLVFRTWLIMNIFSIYDLILADTSEISKQKTTIDCLLRVNAANCQKKIIPKIPWKYRMHFSITIIKHVK